MNRKLKAAVSHHEREVEELRADPELAIEYLKAAMESLDDPDDRAAGLIALHISTDHDPLFRFQPRHFPGRRLQPE